MILNDTYGTWYNWLWSQDEEEDSAWPLDIETAVRNNNNLNCYVLELPRLNKHSQTGYIVCANVTKNLCPFSTV